MTVNEVITECLTYPYSKEAYELQKDIYECELTAMALDSMTFQESNEEFLSESGIDDDFIEFTEKKGEAAYNSFSTKKNSIWGRVLGGLKTLLSKIINFFAAIGDKFTKQTMRIRAIRKFLASAHASETLARKIKKSLEKGGDKVGKKNEASAVTTFGALVSERYEQPELSLGNLSQYFNREEKLTLQAALSLTWIKVAPVVGTKKLTVKEAERNIDKGKSKHLTGALSADVLSHYIQKFCMSKGEAEKLADDMAHDMNNFERDGIKVTVAGNSLQRAINSMKKSKTTLEKASKYTQTLTKENKKAKKKSNLSDTKEYDREAKRLRKTNEAFTTLKVLTGNTMRLYKAIAEARQKIIKEMYEYISKKGAKTNEKVGKERDAMDVKSGGYSVTQTESAFNMDWDDADDYSESYDDVDSDEMGEWFD